MEVKVTDNSEILKRAKDEAVARALEAIGLTAERHAKENTPVDTGRLRNSITHATNTFHGQGTYSDNHGQSYSDATAHGTPEKETVYIGTNVEYAQKQEITDSYHHTTGRAHFLRDAVANHGDEYKKIVEAQLKKA